MPSQAQIKFRGSDTCAAIWTHATDDDAHRITVCTDRVTLDRQHQSQTQTIAYATLDPQLAPGTWHHVEITTPGFGLTVTLDGTPTLSKATLTPQPPDGAVILGAVPTRAGRRSSEAVTFTDVTVAATP